MKISHESRENGRNIWIELREYGIKRVISLVLMVVAVFFFISAVDRQLKLAGLPHLFSAEVFLEHRLELEEMVEQTANNVIDELKAVWAGELFHVYFVPKENGQSITYTHSMNEKALYVYYVLESIGGREYPRMIDLDLSRPMIKSLIEAGLYGPAPGIPEIFYIEQLRNDNPWKHEVQKASIFTRANYEQLKRDFPGISYSEDELRFIYSNGIAFEALHTLVHLKQGHCRQEWVYGSVQMFKASGFPPFDRSIRPYSAYFVSKQPELLRNHRLVSGGIAVGLLLFSAFFFPALEAA